MWVATFFFMYRDRLRNAYEQDFWDGARKTVAALWDAHGWVWHGEYGNIVIFLDFQESFSLWYPLF